MKKALLDLIRNDKEIRREILICSLLYKAVYSGEEVTWYDIDGQVLLRGKVETKATAPDPPFGLRKEAP